MARLGSLQLEPLGIHLPRSRPRGDGLLPDVIPNLGFSRNFGMAKEQERALSASDFK